MHGLLWRKYLKKTLLVATAALLAASATAVERPVTAKRQDALAPSKPAVFRPAWPQLVQARDPWLQEQLYATVKRLGLQRVAEQRKLSIALVDITIPDQPRVAAVNAHEMMYAASLPKICILLAAFQKASEGGLVIDADTEQKLTDMIRVSSNSAATEMLERVGYQYVQDVLQSKRYALYDLEMNGGLWIGKPYAKDAAWKRDPLYNLSHGATAFETARFYYLLETGRLVSPEASRRMKEMLSEPAIRHKFVAGLEASRPGSRIFRKSGTWRTYHADSAIIERGGRRYIAVAMANHASGGRWLSQIIVALDDMIFDPRNVARDRLSPTELVKLDLPAVRRTRSRT